MQEDFNLSEEFKFNLDRFEQMIRDNDSYYFDSEDLEEIVFYYQDLCQYGKALEAIQHALNLFPGNIQLLIREGEVLTAMGQLHRALSKLKSAERVEPLHPDLLMAFAIAYGQLHEHDKSIQYLERALLHSDEDNYDDIALELALEYQNAEKPEKAIELLSHLMNNKPESEAVMYELAYCLETTNRLAEGMEIFQKHVDTFPMNFSGWYCLGNLQQQLEQLEESLESYDFALALTPDFVPAMFNKAQALFKLDQFKEAISVLEDTFEFEVPDSGTLCHIGECYEKLDDLHTAIQCYRRALQLDPNCADAFMGLAVVKDHWGELDEAFACANTAHRLDPENTEYHSAMIKVLMRQEKWDVALQEAHLLMSKKPLDEEAYILSSDIYYNLKEQHAALFTVQQGLEVLPDSKGLMIRRIVLLLASGKTSSAEHLLDIVYNQEDQETWDEVEEYYDILPNWLPYIEKKIQS
jgi:tetratricopeptide (TPR) repeat protein